jgi:hypothetical protein
MTGGVWGACLLHAMVYRFRASLTLLTRLT